MEKTAIKFKLSGETAFFKKPDVNEYAYFTYNNIHKIALLGILGAIIGLKGYNQQTKEEKYPEFYEKLKDLKIAIVPDKKRKGVYSKKIQTFNNSVGYASEEAGGNLIVREQWLEKPCWEIYLLNDGNIQEEIYEKIEEYLLNKKTVYIPYLGKNDHIANISEVELIELSQDKKDCINSLFIADKVELDWSNILEVPYLVKEMQPFMLKKDYNFYGYEEMLYTNTPIKNKEEIVNLYTYLNQSLYFF